MLSQSHLIGSERRSCDHLIGSERRSCDHLPSKQAVAGSSPVSRSSFYTVALEVLHRPLYRKRAVMSKRDGGFFHGPKASNGHLPSFSGTHYFTRNRTHGSVFPTLFLHSWEVSITVPRCFRLRFWKQKRIALHRWTGTISHEASLFL